MFRGKRINFNSLTPLSMTSVQISKSYLLCGKVLLIKSIYSQHHCWALDGSKLGGFFYLSLLLKVFYFGSY